MLQILEKDIFKEDKMMDVYPGVLSIQSLHIKITTKVSERHMVFSWVIQITAFSEYII